MDKQAFLENGIRFVIGTGATTGTFEVVLQGTPEEIQEQLSIVLNMYNQMFDKYLNRKIKEKA